jgi:hypothetical protein
MMVPENNAEFPQHVQPAGRAVVDCANVANFAPAEVIAAGGSHALPARIRTDLQAESCVPLRFAVESLPLLSR